MNKIVPWLKAHWPIPALTVVAIAALPTAMYFAAQMQADFHAKYQKRVTDDANSVSISSATIKYGFPAVDGSGMVLEKSGVVNEAMIASYKKIWEEVQSKVGVVSEKGLAFNKGDHKPIMDGYFPACAPESGREFIRQYIDFHRRLLVETRAGEAAKSEDIAAQLAEHQRSVIDKIKAELGRDPTADEQAALAKDLTGMRIAAVRKRAAEIGVYADPSVFDGVPTSVSEKPPTPAEAWDKQERAWIHQDICRAISACNGGPSATTGVSSSVVKRILKVSAALPPWDTFNPNPAAFDAGEDKAPLNFSVSLTGRSSGPGLKNKWYDVRTVSVDLIVSSQNLPKFLNALAATNFMTVVDLHLLRVEPLADLREGYDYGDEHVVKASLKIETVWLREWRKALMPQDVQKALGMVEGVDPSSTGGGNAPPPPPPRNPRPPTGGGGPGRGPGARPTQGG